MPDILVHNLTLGLTLDEPELTGGIDDLTFGLVLDEPALEARLPEPDALTLGLVFGTPNIPVELRADAVECHLTLDEPALTREVLIEVDDVMCGLALERPPVQSVGTFPAPDTLVLALALDEPVLTGQTVLSIHALVLALVIEEPAAAPVDNRPRYAAPYFEATARAPNETFAAAATP